jgi:hypothetical protein
MPMDRLELAERIDTWKANRTARPRPRPGPIAGDGARLDDHAEGAGDGNGRAPAVKHCPEHGPHTGKKGCPKCRGAKIKAALAAKRAGAPSPEPRAPKSFRRSSGGRDSGAGPLPGARLAGRAGGDGVDRGGAGTPGPGGPPPGARLGPIPPRGGLAPWGS